jgi:hypothetical protein
MKIRVHGPGAVVASALLLALVVLGLLTGLQARAAVTGSGASNTTTVEAEANTTTPLTGLSAGSAGHALVVLSTSQPGSSIALSSTAGLTFLGGTADGSAKLTFTGSGTDANAALAGAKLTAGAAGTTTITVAAVDDTGRHLGWDWGTQHFYEYVPALDPAGYQGQLSWNSALAAAPGNALDGQSGYLATDVSDSTHTLLLSLDSSLDGGQSNGWLGGGVVPSVGASDPYVWAWQAGPLDGTTFTSCTSGANGCTSPGPAPWCNLDNWGGVQDRLVLDHGGCTGWVDTEGQGFAAPWDITGYFVEYGSSATGGAPGVTTTAVTLYDPAAPGAPTSVTATATQTSATIAWAPPTSDGHRAIIGYAVMATPGGATCQPAALSSLTCTISGLTAGTSYSFAVTATNAIGTSAAATGAATTATKPVATSTPTTTAKPLEKPSAPRNATVPARTSSSLTVRWDAPADDGGSPVTAYTVEAQPGGATCQPPTLTDLTCELTGLAKATDYMVQIRATNAEGDSPSTSVKGTTAGVLVVEGVTGVTGADVALVRWSGPGNPRGTTYTAAVRGGAQTCSTPKAECLLRGLAPHASYAVVVTARGPRGYADVASSPVHLRTQADAGRLRLSLDIEPGVEAAGQRVTVSGFGLAPGAPVEITVHSTPRQIGSSTVTDDGHLATTVTLPAGLEAGRHSLIVETTGLDGTPIVSTTSFELTAAGTFAPSAYDPREHPEETIQTLASGMGIALVAGFGGRTLSRRKQRARTGGATGRGRGRRSRRAGDAPEVDMSQQEFRAAAIEPGDRGITWISPWRQRFDRVSRLLPDWLAPSSPLLARFFNDAAYLRAMFGTYALLAPLAGAVLGGVAVHDAHGLALPPGHALMLAIVLLSVFDALGGVAAALVFTIGTVAHGGVASPADLRALIAIDIVMFSVILVVSATRELRREAATTAAEWFDRIADLVIGTIVAMWTIDAAVGALPGLTGLDLPLAHDDGTLVLAVGTAAFARFVLETVAAHWYPKRLIVVAPEAIADPPLWRTWLTIAVQTAMFAFFAVSYMGNTWALWAGTGLFLLALALDLWIEGFPDWPRLALLIPGGIIGMLFYYLLGGFTAAWFNHLMDDPAKVAEYGFVVLMLPGLLCQVISSTARNGEGWTLSWLWRLLGIPMLIVVVLVLQGFIALI